MTIPRLLKRPRVLIVGCGDVGTRVVRLLAPRYRVFALTSQPRHCPLLRAAGALPLVGNLDQPRSLTRLGALAPRILHLAPPPAAGDDDPRTQAVLAMLGRRRQGSARTAAHASATRAHRALHKRALIVPDRAGPSSRAPVLVYASTTGVYGNCDGALVDETRPVAPANSRALRRVAAERRIRAAGRRGVVSPRLVRIPGIYAGDRLPVARLRNGTPALRPEDDVYTSHIHADDLAAIMVRAMHAGRTQRIYHAVDHTRLRMADYFDRVADATGLPRAPRVTRDEARKVLNPNLLSFMSESRQLSNRRLTRELRYRLSYPTVDDFLSTLRRN